MLFRSVESDLNCRIDIPDGKGDTLKAAGTSYSAPYVTAELAKYRQSHPTFMKADFVATFPGTGKIKKFTK